MNPQVAKTGAETGVETGVETEAVVVGGGLAGLSVATYLARGGRRVRLFEKAGELGGRATTASHGEYRFNRGIHALYTGGATSEVLRDLGVLYEGHSPRGLLVLHDGALFPFPADPLALLGSRLLSVGDKLELGRLMAGVPRLSASRWARLSVQEWIDRHARRPRVRALLAGLARPFVYSAALDLVSAEVFVGKLQSSLKHPVQYIDGGWDTLVEGLRNAAEQAGVELVTGTRVESVEHEGGRVVGVKPRGGPFVRAAAVVVATPPREAVKLVDGGQNRALRQAVDALVPAQVACLDVALRALPRPGHPVVQDLEQPRFLSAQSLFARVSPHGGAVVSLFKQLDPRRRTDPRDDERELEDLLDTAQPGWRDLLVERQYLPRIDALGALPTAEGGGFAGRPDPAVAGIEGLLVVGDWVGPEGFLSDASMASARDVARRLLSRPAAPVPSHRERLSMA